MLNYQAFNRWLAAKKSGLHHRQILIIELPFEEVLPIINSISVHFSDVALMASEHSRFKVPTIIPISRYQEFLGIQTDAIIFDASAGMHLNALYAGAGMVRANGLVVVILKPNSASKIDDATFKFSFGQHEAPSYFSALFKERVEKFNGCIISQSISKLRSSKTDFQLPLNNNSSIVKPDVNAAIKRDSKTLSTETNLIKLSVVQAAIADNITENINTDGTDPHTISVILGARGRGKSTLLGAIGAKLNNIVGSSKAAFAVVSCALNKNQLDAVNLVFSNRFKPCASFQLVDRINKNDRLIYRLPFYSPDEIVSLAPKSAIVLIDEIASIAPELLKKIITHFSHIVITGTTSGYEGSGSGFMKRVLPYLQSVKKTNIYELTTPFRWLENDPVEACFADIFSTAPVNKKVIEYKPSQSEIGDIRFRLLRKQELLDNAELYHQVFSLLIQAHYQTTPNDIVRTLDASDCKIFIAQTYSTIKDARPLCILGVAVVFEEGGELLAPLAKDICIGKRRVQGHLTAQAISLQLLAPQVCVNTYLRVNRIAVQSQYYRKGIASGLLAYCEQYAHQNNVDYMSVSFGYTQALYNFWLHNIYLLAKVGQRIDTASGTASLLMIKPVSRTGSINLTTLIDRINLDVAYYLRVNKRLIDLYNGLVKTIVQDNEANIINFPFLQEMLDSFLNKQISFQKFAPGLLAIIRYSGNNLSKTELSILHETFERLHQKGIHKEEKLRLEERLLITLSKVSIVKDI